MRLPFFPFRTVLGRTRTWIQVALALCSGLWMVPAANVRPVTVEALASRADHVVHGSVASLETVRDPVVGVRTQVELEVREVWKGHPTNRLMVALAGGTLGERRVLLIGQPEFRVGEEVVIFTVRNDRNESVLLQLAQGKFTVQRDAQGGAWVHNPLLGSPESPSATTNRAGYRPPNQLPVSLPDLKCRVLAAVTR